MQNLNLNAQETIFVARHTANFHNIWFSIEVYQNYIFIYFDGISRHRIEESESSSLGFNSFGSSENKQKINESSCVTNILVICYQSSKFINFHEFQEFLMWKTLIK